MENKDQFRTPEEKQRDKRWLYERPIDRIKPYRVVAPTYNTMVARFQTLEEAMQYFNTASRQRHQAILSMVDVAAMAIKVIKYSPCRLFNGRD